MPNFNSLSRVTTHAVITQIFMCGQFLRGLEDSQFNSCRCREIKRKWVTMWWGSNSLFKHPGRHLYGLTAKYRNKCFDKRVFVPTFQAVLHITLHLQKCNYWKWQSKRVVGQIKSKMCIFPLCIVNQKTQGTKRISGAVISWMPGNTIYSTSDETAAGHWAICAFYFIFE